MEGAHAEKTLREFAKEASNVMPTFLECLPRFGTGSIESSEA